MTKCLGMMFMRVYGLGVNVKALVHFDTQTAIKHFQIKTSLII